jgi:glucoamylase
MAMTPGNVRSCNAPGCPGHDPRWTSSAKCGVGTALSGLSRVWFTVSHGIVNEVYYPRVDLANTRDLGLIVTDGLSFFSEEKRHTTSEVAMLGPGIPGYRLTNTCVAGRYRIVKTIVTDPTRDVLLQDIRFEPLIGTLADYRVFALLAPHLANQGRGNDGWSGDYKGTPMLFAERGSCALAMAASAGFTAMSCGYVGTSDGWQDLMANKRLTQLHPEARNGNIALTGEVDVAACDGHFVLALAFGHNPAEAGQDARASLLHDFDDIAAAFARDWQTYQASCDAIETPMSVDANPCRTSIAVLRTHEDRGHPGGIIASLSIPWGNHKSDHDLGGYHLVWPRDLVECAGGLLAAGDVEGARQTLCYLMCTQEADGHWAQNMWLDGTPYWNGIQMDETGLPILLADLLRRAKALESVRPWPMVRLAASYLVRNGPATAQDRWEEEPGHSPFTLAVEIAALLAAADFADDAREPGIAAYLRDTADDWNEHVEEWTYVTGSPLATRAGVDGYYARIGPAAPPDTGPVIGSPGSAYDPKASPDALALVRFGLRDAADPRITNTVAVIDAALERTTKSGPVWLRYNGDSYGEHADGSPFDGTGVGRGWPLLAGERGHYEIAAGHADEARRLLDVMQAQTNPGGLIPEQVWDGPDLPQHELFNGHPSGGAMPLAWAHAEYLKLSRSLQDGRVFDMPPQTVRRYLCDRRRPEFALWSFNDQRGSAPAGRTLRISTQAPALVHWSANDWRCSHDTRSIDSHVGLWYADLPMTSVPAGGVMRFTFYWPEGDRWEGADFSVAVTPAAE